MRASLVDQTGDGRQEQQTKPTEIRVLLLTLFIAADISVIFAHNRRRAVGTFLFLLSAARAFSFLRTSFFVQMQRIVISDN